jgi:DnaJ-class molecular chaperone
LRDYYLDLSNLEQTSADDVTHLLESFWTRLGANEQRAAALEALELEDPVDYPAIKQQYRRLAMQHHPDRGGDKAQLQTLNYAMAVLEKCYKN